MTPDWTTFDLAIFLLFVGMLATFGAWAETVISRRGPFEEPWTGPERRRGK